MRAQRGIRAFATLLTFAAAACGQVQGGHPEAAEPPPPPKEIMELLGEGTAAACLDITVSHDFPTEVDGKNPYDICVADLNNFIKDHGYLWPGPAIASNVNTPESYGHEAAFSLLTEFDALKLVDMDATEGGEMLADIMGSLANVRGQIAAINPGIVR